MPTCISLIPTWNSLGFVGNKALEWVDDELYEKVEGGIHLASTRWWWWWWSIWNHEKKIKLKVVKEDGESGGLMGMIVMRWWSYRS